MVGSLKGASQVEKVNKASFRHCVTPSGQFMYKTKLLFLIPIGLTRHHSVAIMGNNTPEWVISDLAAIFAG